MAILDELRAAYLIVVKTVSDFFGGQTSFLRRYARELFFTIGIILFSVVGYLGYRWYMVSREQTAHTILAEYMHDYQLAATQESPEQLERMDSALATEYIKHKESNIAPLFLALRATIQIKQGKRTEAVATLQDVINTVPSSSPIIPLFKTKRALVLLDSTDETFQQTGLKELVELARDKDNRFNDVALFYLGRYYWANDAIQDAKNAWQELVDTRAMQATYPSPWVQAASKALEQIAE